MSADWKDILLLIEGLGQPGEGRSLADSKVGRGVYTPLEINSSCVSVTSDGAAITTSGNLRVHGGMAGDLAELGVAAIVDSFSDHMDIDLVCRRGRVFLVGFRSTSVPLWLPISSDLVLRFRVANVTLDFFRSVAYERLNPGTWLFAEANIVSHWEKLCASRGGATSSAFAFTSR